MTAQRLAAELADKPAALTRLADRLARRDPYAALPALLDDEPAAIVLLGAGAGHYVCEVAAERMRRAGLGASAESATAAFSTPGGPDTLVVAVALGSARRELCESLHRYAGSSAIVVLTDDAEGPETRYADLVVPLLTSGEVSGLESGGAQQALALLLLLASRLGAPTPGSSADVAVTLRRSSNAVSDLMARAAEWVPGVAGLLSTRPGPYLVAPAERSSSARLGALALRRGPVLAAHSCETGEWSHTERHLAAVQDYRALLFAGSRFDERFADHLGSLKGTFVCVGGEVPGAAMVLRYPGDTDPDIGVLTEPVIAELLALHWWKHRR
ncbi:sugar isomerase [Nocardiopsis ansamitocini]|uniref:Sigma factor regulator FecR n=1 Tax=Nocardiopsis ansamitocini TaxID=1670832 RepID=A0A9W6UFV5_9ACTN|nr:sugar isomerase [Nocardiopsis ansamitocini]GLU45931.1 sigma factor regulator FecR [Nocardiopsis ansamitocini]